MGLSRRRRVFDPSLAVRGSDARVAPKGTAPKHSEQQRTVRRPHVSEHLVRLVQDRLGARLNPAGPF